jgi:hypothetical protein
MSKQFDAGYAACHKRFLHPENLLPAGKYLVLTCHDKKGKATPITDPGGPNDCETSRFPHFLENQLTDRGEFGSLTIRPPFTSRKIPGAHFC